MNEPYNQNGAFEFLLLRERLLGEGALPVDEDDPAQWAQIEALEGAGALPDTTSLGRGHLVVISILEPQFVREKLAIEPEPAAQYLLARLRMGDHAPRDPAMGDLLAVFLADGTALVYDVVIAAADIEAAHAAHPLEPESVQLFNLAQGQAILRLRTDFGLIDTAASDEDAPTTTPERTHGEL